MTDTMSAPPPATTTTTVAPAAATAPVVQTAPPVAAPPVAPPPPNRVVPFAEYEKLQARVTELVGFQTQNEENAKRMQQVANLLSGKTADDTATLPPDVVQKMAMLTEAHDKVSRLYCATKIAQQAGAVGDYVDDVAQLMSARPEFAVKADGTLKNPDAANAAMLAFKTSRARYFEPPPAPPAGPPLPGARPPVPPNQQPGVPVAPVELTEAQFAALPISQARAYVAARKAAQH